jgi:Tol biopolymer transport system component
MAELHRILTIAWTGAGQSRRSLEVQEEIGMKRTMLGLLAAALCAALSAGYAANQAKDSRAEVALQGAIKKEVVDGDLKGAIEQYKKLAQGRDRSVAAKALVRMGQCYETLGDAESRKAYERVLRDYTDQTGAVADARVRLTALKSAEPSTITVRRVGAPKTDVFGAPSRDGAYLTFRDSSENVKIYDLATGQIRHLTKRQSVGDSAYASMPSPDGKQVAYTWHQDGIYELRVVGLDGSEPRVLYRNAETTWVRPPDWSPDGKSILTALDRKDGTSQMVLVSVRDGSVRVLKSFDERSLGRPRFSPDGRYIAYAFPQRPGSVEKDIFVLALDGGRETPLVQHPANDVDPDWTPDGKRILFLSDRTGTMGAWWIQVAEGKSQGTPELVKPDLGQDLTPMGFTRNGSYYYGVQTQMRDVYIADLDLATGKLISAPSMATQRFVGSNDRPYWSPDGRELLFLSQRRPGVWGARALCVRSTETGAVRELASKLDQVTRVQWYPDGRSLLAVAQHPAGEFGLFRIDIQTGDFSRVRLGSGAIGWPPAWSGDGKAMFYQRSVTPKSKRTSIVVRDIETGQEKELHSVADPSHYGSGAVLSRDGQQMVFMVVVADTENRATALKVMPAAGGEARDLLRGVQLPFPAPIAWAPDGRSVLSARKPNPRDSKTELWSISVQGGEPRKLDLAAENMRDLSVHPDGRHIAFTAGEERSEVWVMESFLPANPSR